MKKISTIIILLANFLVGCVNKNTPEYVAEQYLIALKNKDWEKAKTYTTKENAQNLDMMKDLGFGFGITEIKDIKCTVDKNSAVCNFCCSDSDFYCLDLLKREDGKWRVVMPKDGGCRGPYEPVPTDTIENQ